MSISWENHSKSPSEEKSVIDEYYGLFAVFSIINYLIPLFFIFPDKGSSHDWTLTVRLISSFLCVGLLFFGLFPSDMKIVRKYYGNFSLCFCLPFFSSVMFLHKSEFLFWCAGLCLSAFLLAILVECSSFIKIFCVGVLSACIVVLIFDGAQRFQLWNIAYLLYVCVFSLAVGVVFTRKKEENNRKIIENLRSLSATIAHEMRTPLTTISIASQNFDKYLREVINGYKKSRKLEAPNKNIDDRILAYLENTPSDIYRISRKNLQLIDMLLKNFKGIDGIERLELCSVKECITRAMDEYAFQANERQLISVSEVEDFQFIGDEVLFIHVIFNLISNSLRHISIAERGFVKIWISQNKNENILHFYDSATGVNKRIMKDIFLPFISGSQEDGTGIGLSFCRDVVEKFNGTIKCFSDGESFTEFQIRLPVVKPQ